jgi:hypothetical protein
VVSINKKLILIILVLSLLVLAGCRGLSRDRPITDADVRKGREGLVMDFIENAPPESVFEGSKETSSVFPIAVELQNKGASDIEKGLLVFGFEKTYVDVVSGDDERQEFNIKGKSVFNPNGDEGFITINAQAKKIGGQSETHPSTILATACYLYKTVFGSSACIDTDIYGIRRGEKVCDIEDLTFGGGQGAPVVITKIETRMLPDVDENRVKPHFIIQMRNMGKGEVISPEKDEENPDRYIYENACTSKSLDYKDFNTLIIKASLSGTNLNCKVSEEDSESAIIRLRDKEDLVRCTLEEPIGIDRGAYVAPLKIELEYGYTFTVSKDIIIEKILTY